MNQIDSNETFNLIIATVSFIALLVIVFFVYKYLFRFFKKRVFKTPGKLDDFILDLFKMLKGNSDWDGRTVNVQVTNATERFKEVRVLLSSVDASKNWDLRTTIRKKLIDFINEKYPDSFAKIRIETNRDANIKA